MNDIKVCTVCGEVKTLDDFHSDKRTPDGRRAACKECVRAQNRAAAKANPGAHRERVRRWKEANPERWKALQKQSRERRKAKRLAENHKPG